MLVLIRIILGASTAAVAILGCLALWVQKPAGMAVTLIAMVVVALWAASVFWWLRSSPKMAAAIALIGLLALSLWWVSLKPSDDRDWAADVAEHSYGVIEGDQATLFNVRNFDWRSDTDFTARWETRRYDLSKIESVDLILSYWGSPAIAHTLVSFGFADGQQLVFSVEIRKERHEQFSQIGGFFKQFELSVIAADERDIVRVRTNVRNEDDYLYRVQMSPTSMRSLFAAYVEQANGLKQTPRFYNTITANCTTIVYQMMTRIVQGLPWDYRLVLSGYLPEYLFDEGALKGATTVEEYRARGRITDRARAHDSVESSAFSKAIRIGVPGV